MGPWVVAQTYKASMLAFSDINRNRKLGRSPRIPYDGVATFKFKTFPLLSHRSIMTEYSFYNYTKTRQSIRSNKQVVRKDASCVANAEIKYSY